MRVRASTDSPLLVAPLVLRPEAERPARALRRAVARAERLRRIRDAAERYGDEIERIEELDGQLVAAERAIDEARARIEALRGPQPTRRPDWRPLVRTERRERA